MLKLILALLLVTTQLSAMENYFWLTHSERSLAFPGDILRFFGRDTLWGPVHSNGWIATQNVGGLPVAIGPVSTAMSGFAPGSPNPPMQFLGGAPEFNAGDIVFPDSLTYLRETALEQGTYIYEPLHEWYCIVLDSIARFYYYPLGTERDTTTAEYFDIQLDSFRRVIFVDGKLDIRGILAARGHQLHLGCSQDIRIVDNIMIRNTNMQNGTLPDGADSRIALASEQGIYIANTWENGRENRAQGSDVVITAFLFAMGTHFQMEQMNDVGDPYIGPSPDERGNIVLTGGITQYHRGYVHRSNRGGSGYNKIYHYDARNRLWRTGVFEPIDPLEEDWVSPVDNPLFPAQFTLSVAPNPFNASTTIRFTLPQMQSVRVRVYDVQGREVMQLADRQYPAGSHVMQFDGESLASGVYFLRLETLGQIETRKLMLIK